MTTAPASRPLLHRPWFAALLVCGTAVLVIALAMTFMIKNMGAIMASQPIRMPINAQKEYQKSMTRLNEAADECSRWVALGRAALWSVDVGRLDYADAFARELQALLVK
jgi:hypothetical protein